MWLGYLTGRGPVWLNMDMFNRAIKEYSNASLIICVWYLIHVPSDLRDSESHVQYTN